jgi:alkylhydroperoxidase family enzyme
MAQTPVEVPSELVAELRRHLGETQLVELTAAIAWENHWARFDQVFGVEPVGFSAGAVCAISERP